jgi:transcriptional antiterminator NusG
MYFIVRVTSSQEKITADILENKATKMENQGIFSIIMPEGMRGYIVIEAESELACRELIANEPHVKGMLKDPLAEAELEKMLVVKQASQEMKVGDIVEFFVGPFKGYKARVIKVDQSKEEITVELMDVAVPIPVTTKSDMAKIIQKSEAS